MGKRSGKPSSGGARGKHGEGVLEVDLPSIYFTHSRVSRWFSGCGVRLEDTLAQIMSGEIEASQLPIITVLGSPDAPGVFFSLNNRRLWVFKELHRQGLISSIQARYKDMSVKERTKYTVERCSSKATLFGPLTRPNIAQKKVSR